MTPFADDDTGAPETATALSEGTVDRWMNAKPVAAIIAINAAICGVAARRLGRFLFDSSMGSKFFITFSKLHLLANPVRHLPLGCELPALVYAAQTIFG